VQRRPLRGALEKARPRRLMEPVEGSCTGRRRGFFRPLGRRRGLAACCSPGGRRTPDDRSQRHSYPPDNPSRLSSSRSDSAPAETGKAAFAGANSRNATKRPDGQRRSRRIVRNSFRSGAARGLRHASGAPGNRGHAGPKPNTADRFRRRPRRREPRREQRRTSSESQRRAGRLRSSTPTETAKQIRRFRRTV
jgi:hypothetical protein